MKKPEGLPNLEVVRDKVPHLKLRPLNAVKNRWQEICKIPFIVGSSVLIFNAYPEPYSLLRVEPVFRFGKAQAAPAKFAINLQPISSCTSRAEPVNRLERNASNDEWFPTTSTRMMTITDGRTELPFLMIVVYLTTDAFLCLVGLIRSSRILTVVSSNGVDTAAGAGGETKRQ